MLILVLAVVAMTLVWLFGRRTEPVAPGVRRAAMACIVLCGAVAVALRAGPAAAVFCLVAGASLALWLRIRGTGGDDPGDDGRDPPPEPDPDPDRPDGLRPERLDDLEFDRARAEWERGLPKSG